MKRFLKVLWFFITYVFYVMITQKERTAYLAGQNKGMDCVNVESDMFGVTAEFNPYRAPKRRYLTYREFKKINYPEDK